MSAGAEPKPSGGPTSALKVAVPLVALVAVVFGLTYITQYTPKTEEEKTDTGPAGPAGEPPLRFFNSVRHWDPPLLKAELGYRHLPLLAPSAVAPSSEEAFAFSLQDRTFQGVYEQSTQHQRATQFWFENRNPATVLMQLKHVSCGSCTGGRVAGIPPEATRSILQHAALTALPVGLFNPFGVALTQPVGELARPDALQWTTHTFDAPDKSTVTYRVPAAPANPDKWTAQWGILELRFKVNAAPGDSPKPLDIHFAALVEDGSGRQAMNQFRIAFEVARPFELSRTVLDAGRLDALSGEKRFDLLVYSATRGPGSEFGDLEPPVGAVSDGPSKFVEVVKVERVPEGELAEVAEQVATDQKKLTRVRAAYRVAVVFRPVAGDARLDIGKFEQALSFASGGTTGQATVKAVVNGPVRLDSGNSEIELTTFSGGKGTAQTFDLTTDAAGVELGLVDAECQPPGFKFTLEKQPSRDDRGHYKLRVAVPGGQVFGPILKGAAVVLEVKGPNPQKMRIPVKGTATN
jgi:hypothetical protein